MAGALAALPAIGGALSSALPYAPLALGAGSLISGMAGAGGLSKALGMGALGTGGLNMLGSIGMTPTPITAMASGGPVTIPAGTRISDIAPTLQYDTSNLSPATRLADLFAGGNDLGSLFRSNEPEREERPPEIQPPPLLPPLANVVPINMQPTAPYFMRQING
jgi:hypothetical protein